MMKRIYLKGDIDEEMLQEFIDFDSTLTPEDEIEVWLDSDGGYCIYAEALRMLFQSYSSDRFSLVGVRKLSSAALDLFVCTDCSKVLIPGTIGMVHTITRPANVDYGGNMKTKFSMDKLLTKVKYPMVDKMEILIKKNLNPQEYDKYLDNEDVYLTSEEIEKFLT